MLVSHSCDVVCWDIVTQTIVAHCSFFTLSHGMSPKIYGCIKEAIISPRKVFQFQKLSGPGLLLMYETIFCEKNFILPAYTWSPSQQPVKKKEYRYICIVLYKEYEIQREHSRYIVHTVVCITYLPPPKKKKKSKIFDYLPGWVVARAWLYKPWNLARTWVNYLERGWIVAILFWNYLEIWRERGWIICWRSCFQKEVYLYQY